MNERIHNSVKNEKHKRTRLVLQRFETVPYDGWQMIKRWVGKRQISSSRMTSANIERQAEMNTITPLVMTMFFTKDEHNRNKIPVFLTHISCKITLADEEEGYRRKVFGGSVFKITIQYGSGPGKLVWDVYRTYWDFVKLHYRYRDTVAQLPSFPSLPKHYLLTSRRSRRHRGQSALIEPEAVRDIVQRYPREEASVTSLVSSQMIEVVQPDRTVLGTLEEYLNELVSSIQPSGYVNRICRFLEISSLGLQLAIANPGFHGKEGSAVLQSRTDKGPKQKGSVIKRSILACFSLKNHKPKWLIVRESYLVCVDDPSECQVYDALLLDQDFQVHRLSLLGDKSNHHIENTTRKIRNTIADALHWASSHYVVCIKSRQGVYHFRTKNERHARQFELAIRKILTASPWCDHQRFGSFSPICHQSALAWFVDGRDYFWDLSVALENAKETIYIHDWWLSPELFLRRPHAKNSEWRLDRVLRRKASQGVKIYIVMYKEVAVALPLYSHLAKRRLVSLSPNIYVQRHPSRALDVFHKDSIFFWAHHEKICVVDNMIAYIGGIDLCFGRYDSPGHGLGDKSGEVWPGKDYSNPRIIDFHTLDKPFEDTVDRQSLPRMPWHDISMRIVGPAARHVARHFVQRWNFLRRKKASVLKRPIPMLLPVQDSDHVLPIEDSRLLHPHTAEACKVQILRSVSPWSIGSIDHVEHSILTAYIESIRDSEHFIYIENQFFITSTKTGNTMIENGIGNAIVDRILRAHRKGARWRAILVIPLVPGFPANINETEATTVRLIMQCQYLSICRGPDSILARLHAAGVENTYEFINIYGLRHWTELNGHYVTEQVYIHAKTIIVDDCKVITGSANINERSQLGHRDSEIAALVEDVDFIDSTLNGQPVKVGRYAHSLRMRLMAEHIGLDVDQIDRDKYTGDTTSHYFSQQVWESKPSDECIPPYVQVNPSLGNYVSQNTNSTSSLSKDILPAKSTFSKRKSIKKDYSEFWKELDCDRNTNGDQLQSFPEYYASKKVRPLTIGKKRTVGQVYQILRDPMTDTFQELWHVLARSNTDLFRRSFLVMPDNNVKTWDDYHHYIKIAKLFFGRTDTQNGGTSTAAAAVTALPILELGGDTIMHQLQHIKGHLVIWPTAFMEHEEEFIFQLDKIPPIEVFD